MASKFQKEIELLLQNKVISHDTAKRINIFYDAQNHNKPNHLFTIFGVLGSLLVGLGIILILAHNWDDFSKSIKTLLAFVPLVVGQGLVGYSIFKNKSVTWREASGTFLFFAVGASIALVSQVYNIPGNLSSFLLTWTLLCIPLIYLLRSKALLFLCLIFASYYGSNYGYGYLSKNNTPWMYLLMLVTLMPSYFSMLKLKKTANSTSIFNWLFPLSLTVVLGTFTVGNSNYGFLMYMLLFGVFYNLGKFPFFNNQRLRRNGYLIIGSLGTIILLLVTSFKWLWSDIIKGNQSLNLQETGISLVLFLMAGTLLYITNFKTKVRFSLFQIVFAIFSVLFFMSYADATIPVVLINILLFILGINAIIVGARMFHFGVLNYGLLIITALVVCRFFDTDMSFVMRGFLFVIVGAGFFATNYMMLKKQKSKHHSISK